MRIVAIALTDAAGVVDAGDLAFDRALDCVAVAQVVESSNAEPGESLGFWIALNRGGDAVERLPVGNTGLNLFWAFVVQAAEQGMVGVE